jgi:hypothetical protein
MKERLDAASGVAGWTPFSVGVSATSRAMEATEPQRLRKNSYRSLWMLAASLVPWHRHALSVSRQGHRLGSTRAVGYSPLARSCPFHDQALRRLAGRFDGEFCRCSEPYLGR